MAESERKNVTVYRSVSLKKLESWSSNRGEAQQKKAVDLEAAGVALPTNSGGAEQPLATRNASLSRKVSKISATSAGLLTADPKKVVSTPIPSLSPSIRQLTEKFASFAGTHRVPPADGAPLTRGSTALPRARCSRGAGSRKSLHEDSSSLEDSDNKTTKPLSRNKPKFRGGADSASGSDSENKPEKRIFRCLLIDGSASSGKRDHSHVSACPVGYRQTLRRSDEEEEIASAPRKFHRSYLSTHHCDFFPLHSDNWPSVTKIRQIFDARQSQEAQQQPDGCEHSEEAAAAGLLHELSPCESALFSDESDRLLPCSAAHAASLPVHNKCIVEAPRGDTHADREEVCGGADFYSEDAGHIESAGKKSVSDTDSFHVRTGSSRSNKVNPSPRRSLSTGSVAPRKTLRTTGLTSDPPADLQPPGTSWRLATSSSSSLQQATVRERKDRQGVGLPRDSLHSLHSSSAALAPTTFPSPSLSSASAPDKASTAETRPRAKVAPLIRSRWKFSSGEEEEEPSWQRKEGVGATFRALSPGPRLPSSAAERNTPERAGSYILSSKNGCWGTKSFGRSSGSEEDSPGPLASHSREVVRRRSLRKKKKASGAFLATGRDDLNDPDGESEDSDSDTALTMEKLERHNHLNKGELAGTRPRSHSARESASHRARLQQWESISSSSPVMSPTLPGVSRVSKVNIPPFNSSPGGSRCSSRYSSTETLKEDDQGSFNSRVANSRTASSSVLSKTYHGNFTMYRSPSFGHGDNFSRAPSRVRPKMIPSVASAPTVHTRQGGASAEVSGGENRSQRAGGNGIDDDGKHGISMSDPDITSETVSLLTFLKSDLSELKVRRASGDKPGVTEGSTFYRMGCRAQGGSRPSLKDLTATLRRTKSFTYSDKPSAVLRCYPRSAAAKRSSSEQQLDVEGEKKEGRLLMSDREVESDGGDCRGARGQRTRPYCYYDDDDDDDDDEDKGLMPRFCDRYVQEARQVIQDICQMSSREEEEEEDADARQTEINLGDTSLHRAQRKEEQKKAGMKFEEKARTDQEAELENTKGRDKHEGERETGESSRRDGQSVQLEKLNSRSTNCRDKGKRQSGEADRALAQVNSEENMFYDRCLDELSGHESSLTDEGIVTEPETGPSDPSERSFLEPAGVHLGSQITRDVLGQPVTAWTKSALHDGEGCRNKGEEATETNILNDSSRPGEAAVNLSKLLPAHLRDSNPALVDLSSPGGLSDVNNPCEDISASDAGSQRSATAAGEGAGPESPMTPLRRRRRFTPHGNNNSTCSDSNSSGKVDSTLGAVGNGESAVYRSFSDPMPQRCCSVDEEGNNGFSSVDSNLLGSLSVKGGGGGCSPEASRPGYKGSVSSDLSVYSDSVFRDDAVHDYSGVIRSIVAEPGAMDRLVTDDNGTNKVPKKKSFSDPSRRSDAPLLSQSDNQLKGQTGSAQPIGELDQSGQIPPSSSEPILSKQSEELWVPDPEPKWQAPPQPNHRASSKNKAKKVRSQSENSPSRPDDEGDDGMDQCDDEQEMQKFNFDVKLAGVLSPRMIRRHYRKRSNRLAQYFPNEDPLEPLDLCSEPQEGPSSQTNFTPPPQNLKPRPKHLRHASEPTTFIPISPPPPPPLQPLKESGCLRAGYLPEPTILSEPPGGEAPPLEEVTRKTQKYDVEPSKAERDTESSGPLIAARDGAPPSVSERPSETTTGGITEAGPQKKNTEDTVSMDTRQKTKPRVDMRKHVMMTLVDTEQSYVESLRTLIQGYMRPLKQPDSSSIVDPLLVDEIFYQIPEILEHHENFLEQVAGCVAQWHDRQTVGQILIQSFSKETLANMYSAYIDNFLNAKDAVRTAKEAKPAFHKFLEQSMRENKEKQALGDLMIKPVQRIPRYELLVKDLLKHTSEDHPDHLYLLDAQRNIKHLAEKINKGRRSAEEAEREARVIQEIEAHIEGIEHILNPQRKFIRQEMVMEAKTVGGKKDRSLFLFSDLIICTTLKRKSGSLRRSSMSLYSAASAIDTSSKYKFLWKLPLEDVEVVKSSIQATNKESIQKIISRLDEDLSTLGQISKLSETLSLPHQSLDEAIKDLLASVHKELSEKQSLAFSMTFLPTKLEFTTASAESSFVFEFSSPDARSNFEQAFEDAKKKLAMTKDQWDPEFLKAIPIMKTRSGMQFSCASPSHCCPDSGCEVWVCNSDGYVGQVCLLNIKDEPMVEACIAVCSARIICIAAVPGLKGRDYSLSAASAAPGHPQQQLHIAISHSSLELAEQSSGPRAELGAFDSDDTDDEDSPSPSSTLQSQASHSTISSSYGNDEGQCPKDIVTETTSSEEEQEFPVTSSYGAPGMLGMGGGNCVHTENPMDGRAMRRSSRGSFTRASLEDLLSIDPEAYQSSVWLGTEDGCIHVYQSSDNIRNRKNSMKMQHSSSILCVLYLDNKVFVSLANGEVIVYQREAGSFWDPQSSQMLVLGTASNPVTKMVPVGGKLWCGSQNRVLIINTTTLKKEHWFQVGTDSSRCVTCMVAYGQGVWLALQGSALVRLYHAQSWESLTEVDVAPAVHKMLAGADAIIRQHKAACLRITALLACKDMLWIGTSAGVVLTLAIPAVSAGTSATTLKSPLVPMGSAHGHTGHVRFLTAIELPEGFDMKLLPPTGDFPGNQSQGGSTTDGNLHRRDSARRRASAHLPPKTNHLVISGGDGYEDFRLTNSSETVGRDDSTNHLLLWRV